MSVFSDPANSPRSEWPEEPKDQKTNDNRLPTHFEIHIQQLGRYLIGRSPFNIKHFTYMAYTDFAGKRGAMELYCAISGIEQALWEKAM